MVRDLGGAAVVADRIAAGSFEVLVNATSVGSRSPESPVPDPETLRGTTVLDCVMRPRRTRLIEQATSVGATTIDGIEMWLHQGAAQASLWLGRDIEVEALRSLLPTALGL
jgi:shikimate 5-dehydrogenase